MARDPLKERFPVWEVACINLRHNSLLTIGAAAVWCLLTPVLVGTSNLEEQAAALPLEMFVSLIGIILLTPVFRPEQNEEINDLVSSKYISTTRIYGIRTAVGAAVVLLLIGLFSLYMGMRNCHVTLLLALGTLADSWFLGALGMFTSALCGNTVIGYMPPILYYALNIGMGPELGNFYLFSMTRGEYGPKLWLSAAGLLLAAGALFYQKNKSRIKL